MALVVTIDSKENAMHAESDAVLLRVSNKLLFTWYQSNTAPAEYVSLVNGAILDKVIQLKPESEELAQNSIDEHALCLQLHRRRPDVPG